MHCRICDTENAVWDGTDYYCYDCLEWHEEQMNDWYWIDYYEDKELEEYLEEQEQC